MTEQFSPFDALRAHKTEECQALIDSLPKRPDRRLESLMVDLKRAAEENPSSPGAADVAEAIGYLEEIPTGVNAEAILLAIAAGCCLQRLALRNFERYVVPGFQATEARRKGGSATSKCTAGERAAMSKRRDDLVSDYHCSAAEASRQVAADLLRGECPGVDRTVELAPETIRKLGNA